METLRCAPGSAISHLILKMKKNQPAPSSAPKAKSRYTKVGDQTIQPEANYLRPGRHLVMVVRMEEGDTRKRKPFVAARVVVLSTQPDSHQLAGRPHRPGEEASWFQDATSDYFDNNMARFALVATGGSQADIAQKEEELGTSIIEWFLSEEQPLAGVVMEANVELTLKKESRLKGVTLASATSSDVFSLTRWVRRVPFAEVADLVSDKVLLGRLIPDLEEKIASESEDDSAA